MAPVRADVPWGTIGGKGGDLPVWERGPPRSGGRDRTEGPYLQEALPGGHVFLEIISGGWRVKDGIMEV